MKLKTLFFILISVSSISLQAQVNTSVLDRLVDLNAQDEKISRVLQKLEIKGNFKLAYSSKSIDVNKSISIEVKQKKIREVLRTLFPANAVEFKVVGNGEKVAIVKKNALLNNTPTQTVRGMIRDINTNQPLIGVAIILTDSDPIQGVSTDRFGRFKFEKIPVGRRHFKTSYLGYKPKTITNISVNAGKEVILTIQLKESVTQLEKVVITTEIDKSKALNDMALVSAKSFTIEETSRYAGSFNDPARMVTSYAGVSSGQEDTENKIVIRGNSPKGVQWRLEGVEVSNPNHFSSDDGASHGAISMLNSNVLTNSDFLTGAFPAEYGNALSGVFDLKLRNGNNEKREYALQAGLIGIDASFEGPFLERKNLPNPSYLLNYRYSTLDILERIGIPIAEGGVPAFQDIAFKFRYPTAKLGVFSLWGLGGTSHLNEQNFVLGQNIKLINNESYKMGITGLSHLYNISTSTYVETILSYTANKYTYFSENLKKQQVFIDTDEKYINSSLNLSSTMYKKFSAKHNTKIGIIYSNIGYNLFSEGKLAANVPNFQVNENGSTNMWQSFISHKVNITDELTMTGGVHFLTLGLTKQTSIEPRLGLQWQFADNQALSIGFGMHSKREESSLYFTEIILSDGTITQPNTKLGFAKSAHYVMGYDRKIGDDFRLKVEAYYQHLYNIPIKGALGIVESTINAEDSFVRIPLVNKGKGKNYGIEVTFEKFFSKHYYFLLTGSVYQSLYEVNGHEFNTRYNGKYNVNFVAGKEFKVGNPNKNRILTLGIEGVAEGGNRTTPINLEASIAANKTIYYFDKSFEKQLGDYYRIDFQVAIKTNKEKVTHQIKFDIQNVTANKNIIFESYSPEKKAIVPRAFAGEIIPVLSYKITF